MKVALAFLTGALLVAYLDLLGDHLQLEEDYDEATEALAKVVPFIPRRRAGVGDDAA